MYSLKKLVNGLSDPLPPGILYGLPGVFILSHCLEYGKGKAQFWLFSEDAEVGKWDAAGYCTGWEWGVVGYCNAVESWGGAGYWAAGGYPSAGAGG